MKKWTILFLATIAIGLFTRVEPTGTDVATLEPVKLLYVDSKNGAYYVTTDTGQTGRGTTVATAIADLKATSTGKVFLDTAEHLLVSRSARESLGRFSTYLRPDCSVTISVGTPDAEKASSFLDAHKPDFTLNDLRAGDDDIPVLYCGKGEMRLEKP